MKNQYNSINDWLFTRFGERVYKVSLESGCSCPNRDGTAVVNGCIFCNPMGYNPATSLKTGSLSSSITSQIETGLGYIRIRHRAKKAIAYFQRGSNTHAPAERLSPMFMEALSHPSVVGLAVSTRPDCIGMEHAAMFRGLAKDKLLWVELGLQSAHDPTLLRIERGHTVADFSSACAILKEAGIPVCAHIILGLPGEDRDAHLETARFLNEAGVWGVKIHNLHILKDTKLERLHNEGAVTIPTLETYAKWVVDLLEVLDPDIIIHRVNGHSPRALTIAPKWSVNKLAIFNAVEKELERRDTRQGKKFK